MANDTYVTDPLEPVPKKCLSSLCPISQQKETEFGSEAKESFILWSENGELGAPALEHRLSLKGHGRGCFVGSLHWEVWNSCGAGAAVLLTAPDHSAGLSNSAHSPPPPSWVAILHTVPKLRCWHSPFTRGTLVWRSGSKVTAYSTLWASETRLSTKEKKKVRFYFIIQIPEKLLMCFVGDT